MKSIPAPGEMLELIQRLQRLSPGFQDLIAYALQHWSKQRQAAEKPRLN